MSFEVADSGIGRNARGAGAFFGLRGATLLWGGLPFGVLAMPPTLHLWLKGLHRHALCPFWLALSRGRL